MIVNGGISSRKESGIRLHHSLEHSLPPFTLFLSRVWGLGNYMGIKPEGVQWIIKCTSIGLKKDKPHLERIKLRRG
jgi:hypothetical protein